MKMEESYATLNHSLRRKPSKKSKKVNKLPRTNYLKRNNSNPNQLIKFHKKPVRSQKLKVRSQKLKVSSQKLKEISNPRSSCLK